MLTAVSADCALGFGMRDHGWFLLLGLLLFSLNYIFAYRAQIYITSALTAIAFTAIVWMNIINARLFLRCACRAPGSVRRVVGHLREYSRCLHRRSAK